MGYIGICRCELRIWFSSSLLWDRVYKSESLGVEKGIILQETDQLVEANRQVSIYATQPKMYSRIVGFGE